jgi:hypothetical protein
MPDEKKKDQPLDKPEVEVQAEPKSNSNDDRRAARRAQETIQKTVKEAVEKSADKGAKKQFEAADDEIDRAKDGISPRHVKQVKVRVKGKDAEGDEVVHERTVKPKGS